VGPSLNDPVALATAATQNTMVGGSGDNYLQGGNLNPLLNPPSAFNASWNILQGGPGLNVLQGGNSGASLFAGPNNDQLIGGTAGVGNTATTVSIGGVVFIAGSAPTSYTFVAGPADGKAIEGFAGPAEDLLTGSGGGADNQFQWTEGDGSVSDRSVSDGSVSFRTTSPFRRPLPTKLGTSPRHRRVPAASRTFSSTFPIARTPSLPRACRG
jgi:hypothetical protein